PGAGDRARHRPLARGRHYALRQPHGGVEGGSADSRLAPSPRLRGEGRGHPNLLPASGEKGRSGYAAPAWPRRARPQTEALIQRLSSLFGAAPILVSTRLPSLKTISVGIDRMPYLLATPGFS